MSLFNNTYFDRYRRKAWLDVFGIKEKKPFMWAYWKRQLRKFVSKQDMILEVGCGLGECLRSLDREFRVIGCDISFDAIRENKGKVEAPLLVTSAEILPFKENSFQALIILDVVEHLPNPERFFQEAWRVLKVNGRLIFSTPNPGSFGARVKGRLPELDDRPYDQRAYQWFGYRDDTHINIRSIDEWRHTLDKAGFSIMKDGSDTLWDIPYFKVVPYTIQKLFFISLHWIFVYAFGFFPWRFGENYVCSASKKRHNAAFG